MRQSESTAAFYKAFCAAQARIGGAVKDSRNDHFNRTYADLGAIWGACKVGLAEAGIGVIQAPEPIEGLGLCLLTRMVHGESGEWIESTLPLIVLKNDMQGLGSAITYARRYCLAAMVGVWTEDDDGELAVRTTGAQKSTDQEGLYPDERAIIKSQFRAESWAALLARRVRETNQEWRNELAIENVPSENRGELISQEEVVNGLVKRALAANPPLVTPEDVTSGGKRDLTKAKATLVGLYQQRPRKMAAALEKYLAGKLQEGKERLARAKADETSNVLKEETLSN